MTIKQTHQKKQPMKSPEARVKHHPLCSAKVYEQWAEARGESFSRIPLHELDPQDRADITEKNLNIQSKKAAVVIAIRGVIVQGDPWFSDEVSSDEVCNAIRNCPMNALLEVRIDTPGGSVNGAQTIMSSLREHRGEGRVIVEGMAASAGSLILLARQDWARLAGAELATIFIHNPWGVAVGDHRELDAAAKRLVVVRDTMLDLYTKVAGKAKRDEIAAMLDDETLLSVKDATELKFITGMLEEDEPEDDDSSAETLNAFSAEAEEYTRASLTEDIDSYLNEQT